MDVATSTHRRSNHYNRSSHSILMPTWANLWILKAWHLLAKCLFLLLHLRSLQSTCASTRPWLARETVAMHIEIISSYGFTSKPRSHEGTNRLSSTYRHSWPCYFAQMQNMLLLGQRILAQLVLGTRAYLSRQRCWIDYFVSVTILARQSIHSLSWKRSNSICMRVL